MRGRNVLTQCSLLKRTKRGIMVTMPGSISVLSTSMKRASLPGKRSRAKPKPTSEEDSTVPTMLPTMMMRVFLRKTVKGAYVQAFRKLPHMNSRGIHTGGQSKI